MSETGVTAPQGFSAAATRAGIKPSGKPDVAIVVNEGPEYAAAAVFTRNKVFAAPVKVSREAVAGGALQAVVFNSGNANACTGAQGEADAREMQRLAAQGVGADPVRVAVCSTGIIGDALPMEKVAAGIGAAATQLGDHGAAAAEAIMTTDTVAKQVVVRGSGWTLGAMGKGAGMMAPSLATMLVCVTTDAQVSSAALQRAVEAAVADTFNTLDIDGSTSTNDTVIAMASGASGVAPAQEELDAAVHEACAQLAALMQSDAEGVTKRVSITVAGAADDAQALEAARTIGRDNLVKTAMFGSDPNWGFLPAVRQLCDAHGILLIVDEVQTGVGRTGDFFAFEHEGVLPDVITMAKGLGGGLPIGATIARGPAAGLFTAGSHGTTFGGNPVACAAAGAVLRTVDDGFLAEVRRKGQLLRDEASRIPGVKDVRGRGLMLGVVLDAEVAKLVVTHGLERGVILNAPSDTVIRLTPPLVINDEEIRQAAERLAGAIADATERS